MINKKNILGLIVIGLVLLTGCSKKYELNCEKTSMSQGENVSEIVENISLTYDGDKEEIDNSTMTFKVKLSKNDEEKNKQAKKEIEDYCTNNKEKFEECKIDIKDDEIVITAKGKVEEYGIIGLDNKTKYDDAEKILKENVYVCK